LREIPSGQDGDFTEKALVERTNNELVANIGNFIHRALSFLWANFDGEVPKPEKYDQLDKDMENYIKKIAEDAGKEMENNYLDKGLKKISDFSSFCNQYFQKKEPWKTKDSNCLYLSINAVRSLAILLEPFIPSSAEKLWQYLNLDGSVHKQKWDSASQIKIKSGHKINKPEILFKKIEIK
jgi:methionyl-tRNA synthetase